MGVLAQPLLLVSGRTAGEFLDDDGVFCGGRLRAECDGRVGGIQFDDGFVGGDQIGFTPLLLRRHGHHQRLSRRGLGRAQPGGQRPREHVGAMLQRLPRNLGPGPLSPSQKQSRQHPRCEHRQNRNEPRDHVGLRRRGRRARGSPVLCGGLPNGLRHRVSGGDRDRGRLRVMGNLNRRRDVRRGGGFVGSDHRFDSSGGRGVREQDRRRRQPDQLDGQRRRVAQSGGVRHAHGHRQRMPSGRQLTQVRRAQSPRLRIDLQQALGVAGEDFVPQRVPGVVVEGPDLGGVAGGIGCVAPDQRDPLRRQHRGFSYVQHVDNHVELNRLAQQVRDLCFIDAGLQQVRRESPPRRVVRRPAHGANPQFVPGLPLKVERRTVTDAQDSALRVDGERPRLIAGRNHEVMQRTGWRRARVPDRAHFRRRRAVFCDLEPDFRPSAVRCGELDENDQRDHAGCSGASNHEHGPVHLQRKRGKPRERHGRSQLIARPWFARGTLPPGPRHIPDRCARPDPIQPTWPRPHGIARTTRTNLPVAAKRISRSARTTGARARPQRTHSTKRITRRQCANRFSHLYGSVLLQRVPPGWIRGGDTARGATTNVTATRPGMMLQPKQGLARLHPFRTDVAMSGIRLSSLVLSGGLLFGALGCRHASFRPADCLPGAARWQRDAACADATPHGAVSQNLDRPYEASPSVPPQQAESPSHQDDAAGPSAPAPEAQSDDEASTTARRATALADLKALGARVSADDAGSIFAVDLAQTAVTDADLAAVAQLPRLRELNLRETLVSDPGLEAVAGLGNLEFLGLTGTLVTDAGLQHLAGLQQLRFLTLGHTIVTDAGLESLAGCSRLEALNLKGTEVTAAGVARLQRRLPECRIISDVAPVSTDSGQDAEPQIAPDADEPTLLPEEAGDAADSRNVSFPEGRRLRFGIPLPPDDDNLPAPQPLPGADPFAAPAGSLPAPAVQRSDFSQHGQHGDAQQRLMLVLRDKLEDPDVLRAIADVYAAQNQWHDARKVLQAALERSPNSRQLHFELGVVEARCGDYFSALSHFERSGGTAQAHYNLGVLLYEAGLAEASVYEFRQALQHDPHLTQAREWLVHLNRLAADASNSAGPVLSDEEIRSLLGGSRRNILPAGEVRETSFGVDIRPQR